MWDSQIVIRRVFFVVGVYWYDCFLRCYFFISFRAFLMIMNGKYGCFYFGEPSSCIYCIQQNQNCTQTLYIYIPIPTEIVIILLIVVLIVILIVVRIVVLIVVLIVAMAVAVYLILGIIKQFIVLLQRQNNKPMIDNQYREDRQFGENEDLELAIDRQNQFQDEDLKTKIGKVENFKKDGKQIEAYLKKEHCEESIKDLVKYIRKDVPENPKVCLILSELNIIESDLIKILVLHAQDKKLSFWLLALMSYLTSKPSQHLFQTQKQKLTKALQEYKKTFTKNQGITYLILHISDYVKTPIQKRQKAHIQMMEFIILLIRNLLQVRTEDVGSDQLHSHFLLAMIKEDLLGPLFYLLQNQKGAKVSGSDQYGKSQLMQRIEIPLLEIFYHFFTCFDPKVLYDTKKPINIRQQAMKFSNKKTEPVRHSRFMPNFAEKNQSGVHRIVHNLDAKQQPTTGQRKAPVRAKELKKVKKIQREYIQESYLQILVDTQQDGNRRSIRELVFEYAKQFVEVEFEIMSRLVFDSIYKETAKVSKQNIMQYLILSSWELKMTRCKYHKGLSMAKTPQEKGAVEFDFGQVLCIMQTGHFELIYKLLFRQATRQKKKAFDINMFNAALILFLNYLEVIQDISSSFNMSDRKNANALMANMFRHDIARIFKIGFHQIIHERILRTLILLTYKFFKLLSQYSGGKVLIIQTNKMLKPKKKGRKNSEEEDKNIQGFISEDSDADNQSGSYNQQDQKKQAKKKQKKEKKAQRAEQDEIRFQQRKFNEVTEFAIVSDYETISKYLIFLKNEQFLQNSKELNIAIFFYFQKIVTLLKGQWLFFQAQTMIAFNQILNSSQFAREYPKQRDTIKKICASFIKLLKKNRLALVESLFRFSSLQTKDQILKNYADGNEQIQDNHVDQQFF